MDEDNIKFECGTILRTKHNVLSFLCLGCRVEFVTISKFIEHGHINCYKESSFPLQFEFKDVENEDMLTNSNQFSSVDPNLTANRSTEIDDTVKKSMKKRWSHTWTCDICLQTKNTNETVIESVKRHMKQFHNAKCELKRKPKLHQCDLCLKSFRLAQYLSDHRAVHLGETPYQCDSPDCTYKSASKGLMYRHTRIYHNNYDAHKYVCHQCGKKLQSAQNLESHTNGHLNLKPYSCDE